MAVHQPATIGPGALEVLQAWVPHQPWAAGADTSTLTRLGSYRFDDADGEVGTGTHLRGTVRGWCGSSWSPDPGPAPPAHCPSSPLALTLADCMAPSAP